MHKTGTSSIQEALSSFNDNGILYGDLVESNHSLAFYTLFSKNYMNYHVWKKRGLNINEINEKRNSYLTRITNQLTDVSLRKVIFSAESIGLLEEDEKRNMICFFNRHGMRINVICYVREPVSFCYSIFQEDIKSGSTSIKDSYNPRYKCRLEEFNKNPMVNDLIVRDYGNLKDGDILSDFFNVLGLKENCEAQIIENKRLPISAIKLIFLVNKSIITYERNQNLYETRLHFNNIIRNAYYTDNRNYQDYFNLNIDYSDINYLYSNYNIDYNQMSNADYETSFSILNLLEDLSDVDPTCLINLAKDIGIKYSKQEIDILAMDIFNHYLLH